MSSRLDQDFAGIEPTDVEEICPKFIDEESATALRCMACGRRGQRSCKTGWARCSKEGVLGRCGRVELSLLCGTTDEGFAPLTTLFEQRRRWRRELCAQRRHCGALMRREAALAYDRAVEGLDAEVHHPSHAHRLQRVRAPTVIEARLGGGSGNRDKCGGGGGGGGGAMGDDGISCVVCCGWIRGGDWAYACAPCGFDTHPECLFPALRAARRGGGGVDAVALDVYPRRRGIGARGAAALGRELAGAPELVSLDLGGGQVRCAGAAALAHSLVGLPLLATLSLRDNGVGDAGAAALAAGLSTAAKAATAATAAATAATAGLETLDLSSNRIGPAGAAALAAVLCTLPGLTALRLTGNRVGPEGASALAAAFGGDCKSVVTSGGGISEGTGGLDPSERACRAPFPYAGLRLRSLELGRNRMGVVGAQALGAALSAAGALPALRVLHVERNGLGVEGAAALAAGLAGRRLRALRIGMNRIDAAGATALRAFVEVSSVVTLSDYASHQRPAHRSQAP
jgi:hypothetical protein